MQNVWNHAKCRDVRNLKQYIREMVQIISNHVMRNKAKQINN